FRPIVPQMESFFDSGFLVRLFPPWIDKHVHNAAANRRAVGRNVVQQIDANGSWFASSDDFNRFALYIRLATPTANGAENFSPGGNHHFCADFARRRSLS